MNTLFNFENKIKKKVGRGEAAIGVFLLSGSSFIAEAMAQYRVDWILVDMEASHASKADLLHVVQAINSYDVTPMVRVASHDKHLIESSLDFGVRGVLVPKVNTKSQAEEVTGACYYPPKGTRGVNCIRASGYYTRAKQYFDHANDAVVSAVQIESREAVDNSFEIAGVPTVDILFVGPGDLAASYGQNGIVTGERMDDARKRVVEACRSAGTIPGIFAHSVESANLYLSEGFRFIGVGNDIKFLSTGLGRSLVGLNRK